MSWGQFPRESLDSGPHLSTRQHLGPRPDPVLVKPNRHKARATWPQGNIKRHPQSWVWLLSASTSCQGWSQGQPRDLHCGEETDAWGRAEGADLNRSRAGSDCTGSTVRKEQQLELDSTEACCPGLLLTCCARLSGLLSAWGLQPHPHRTMSAPPTV